MTHPYIKLLYNRWLRPHLPRKIGVYSDVPCRGFKLLDRTDHLPDYKHGLIDAIHDGVQTGDDVTLVGFGRGVTTVHALRECPERVEAYEAADSMIDTGRETLALADVDATTVDIRHAVVGEAIKVFGSAEGAGCVNPSELDGDVLICDCEGAELSILDGLDSEAFGRYIIETHPGHGATETDVMDKLPDSMDVEVREHHREKPEKAVVVATR